jgi:hypothetical protein
VGHHHLHHHRHQPDHAHGRQQHCPVKARRHRQQGNSRQHQLREDQPLAANRSPSGTISSNPAAYPAWVAPTTRPTCCLGDTQAAGHGLQQRLGQIHRRHRAGERQQQRQATGQWRRTDEADGIAQPSTDSSFVLKPQLDF